MKYLISAYFTVEGEDEDDARSSLSQCLTAALTGEPGPIEDYSVEDTLESYSDDGTIYVGGDK